jgi:Zn-finger nucleic acid-binding protein
MLHGDQLMRNKRQIIEERQCLGHWLDGGEKREGSMIEKGKTSTEKESQFDRWRRERNREVEKWLLFIAL